MRLTCWIDSVLIRILRFKSIVANFYRGVRELNKVAIPFKKTYSLSEYSQVLQLHHLSIEVDEVDTCILSTS